MLHTRLSFFANQPFQTHDPTTPTESKNFWPTTNPTQPNPWVNPTHGQLCCLQKLFVITRTAFVTAITIDKNAKTGTYKTVATKHLYTHYFNYNENCIECSDVTHLSIKSSNQVVVTLNMNNIWIFSCHYNAVYFNWCNSSQDTACRRSYVYDVTLL